MVIQTIKPKHIKTKPIQKASKAKISFVKVG